MTVASLSPRQIQVLRLVARGYTNREIGKKLELSARTIETHRINAKEKIGAKTRADLVRYWTWLEKGPPDA